MEEAEANFYLSPVQIAGVYVIFGVGWILISDLVVFYNFVSEMTAARLQILKGTIFVGVSGLLIYGLTGVSQQTLSEMNTALQQRTQQTHLLHRTLRHNLRNKCNIIQGYARIAETECDTDSIDVVLQQTSELIALSEKSTLIRNASLGDSPTNSIDLVESIELVLDELEQSPIATDCRIDLPAEAEVLAHPAIGQALRELIWNAHKHGEPPVCIRIDRTQASVVTMEITDQGPGLPEIEQTVLEDGMLETQTRHSRGLGLWLVHYLMEQSDGAVSVSSPPDGPTTIQLQFSPTEKTAINRLLS